MKKVIISTLIILLAIIFIGMLNGIESTYTIEATVIDVDNDVVTVEDTTHNVYQYKGIATKSDVITLIMNDNHTSTRIDDKIIDIKHWAINALFTIYNIIIYTYIKIIILYNMNIENKRSFP